MKLMRSFQPKTSEGRKIYAPALAAAFAPTFALVDTARDEHTTPWGSVQAFAYVVLRRESKERMR
jgi:hypothetical protein